MNDNLSEPSGNAVDVVETAKTTSARQIFFMNIARVRELLKAGADGINSSKQMPAELLAKITEAIAQPEVAAKGDQSEVEFTEDGMIKLRLTKERGRNSP